jgi:preprotein translocase subunit SecF
MGLRLIRDETKIDFIRGSRWVVGASIVLFVLSLIAIPLEGINLGIDFRGGTVIMAKTDAEPDVGAFRSALTSANLGEVAITRISDPASQIAGGASDGLMVRLGGGADADSAGDRLVSEARAAMTSVDPSVRILSVETVGAKVSNELLFAGVGALLLSIGAILIYIWLRFEWQFAVGAVVAVAHDVVLTIGCFIVLNLEFNLTVVAALLTLIGYGINDTVVVFDRVRENLRRYKTMPLRDLLNLSINQTLARTVVTSLTTAIAIFAMLIFGGEVIRGFNIAMLWGVAIGTYSSIYVASLMVLRLGVEREPKDADAAAGVKFGSAEAP